MTGCPDCGEMLMGMTNGRGENIIFCADDCGFERLAVAGDPSDDEIMEAASEKYWLRAWSNA